MSDCDYVMFRGGLAVPLAAVRLAWDFEERGLRMGVDGDMLTIGPKQLVTEADRTLIRQWKPHLIALATYSADGTEAAQ